MRAAAVGSALVLAGLLAASGPASAQPVPPPEPYMARLLADDADDWPSALRGHDLIALDAYPQNSFPLGRSEVLVLRLTLGGGYGATGADSGNPELSESIEFSVNGVRHLLGFWTTDDRHFYPGGELPSVRGPFPVAGPDGRPQPDRFAVEGVIGYPLLGIAAGDVLSGWSVQGKAGTDAADAMPGPVPGLPACAPPAEGCAFDIGNYTVPSVEGHYFQAAAPALLPPLLRDLPANVTVCNALPLAQVVDALAWGDGVRVSFEEPARPSALGTLTNWTATVASAAIDLPANGTARFTLNVTHDPGARIEPAPPGANATFLPATVSLLLSSSLGGWQAITIPVQVRQPESISLEGDLEGDLIDWNASSPPPDKGTPAPALPLLLAALALAATTIRRRD